MNNITIIDDYPKYTTINTLNSTIDILNTKYSCNYIYKSGILEDERCTNIVEPDSILPYCKFHDYEINKNT